MGVRLTLFDLACAVIQAINQTTGRNYRPRNPNGTPTKMAECVMARLKEGYTVQDFERVIAHKWKQWGNDPKWSQYVNPETLSRPSHFAKYLGEAEPLVQKPELFTKPEQVEIVDKPADPERIREALAKGWSILKGKPA